ncbi:hypothetical protein C0991_006500, partial [Blastosporella zonata]
NKSRASRILQKVTGRIRGRKATKDDNHPYPTQAASRTSVAGFKPYMSHPMLSSTLVEPYGSGDDQYSSSQSGSPSGSLFRRPEIDGLPISLTHDAPPLWTNNNTVMPHTRPPRPSRPPPEAPTHRPSTPVSDPSEMAVIFSGKPVDQLTTMTNPRVETPSTFSPARLFTRKASRPILKEYDGHDETPPPVPAKHRQTPSIVIDPPPDALIPGVRRPKPARIDTGLSFLTKKASRNQLHEPSTKRTSDDPPTPHRQRHSQRSPSPPPPLPKSFSTRSTTPTPATLGTSSIASSASSTSSYHTSFSTATTTTTTATTPVSTSTSTSTSTPAYPPPPKLTTALSTSAVPLPTSPPPPILQRSGTAPHYRLSLQLTTTGLRAPLNLPTLPLPPSSPIALPSSSIRGGRVGLRDMPELSRDGGPQEHDDDDDIDIDIDEEDMYMDEEGRISRSSGRITPYRDRDRDEDGDEGYRPRPSYSSSVGSIGGDTAESSGRMQTHSRESSASYHHPHSHSHNHNYSHSKKRNPNDSRSYTTNDKSTTSFTSTDFLQLPGPDTSRLDLNLDFSFLDRSPSPPAHDRKGKGRARPEDDSEERDDGGKTPTSGSPYPYSAGSAVSGGGYFAHVHAKHEYVPVREESLKLRVGPEVLGRDKGTGAKGKERDRAKELDTARPGRPPPLQVSVSMGGYGGLGVGLGGGGGSFYASKRASRSLVDLGAVERREKVEELVRVEEKKMERRRSRMSRIEGSVGLGLGLGGGEEVVVEKREEVVVEKREEVIGDPETLRSSQTQRRVPSSDVEGTSPAMATPVASKTNRLSMAPAYDTVVRPSPSIRRRRSMPMFTETTEPPPYPSFPPLSPSNLHSVSPFGLHNHHTRQLGLAIQPRDDEGKERLPPYSNEIYMRAVLPRKMEFVSAGVKAKDRKWRRVVCVVERTVLKVYKPPRERGGSALGDWWERKVGVGDKSSAYGGPVGKPKKGESEGENADAQRVQKLVGEGAEGGQTEFVLREPSTPITPISPARAHPVLTGEHPYVPGLGSIYGNAPLPQANRSRLNLAMSSLLRPGSSKPHSRSNSDAVPPSSLNLNLGSSSPRQSLNIQRPGNSGSISSSTGHGGRSSLSSARPGTPSDYLHSLGVPSSASSRRSSITTLGQMVDDPRDLICAYTMQNAESGLGNDYIKRKHVIRVRSEGEQFLLQAKDVQDVVAWIEVLQASANVALDLDERLMPKGPLFPRRRRRRARPAATTTTATSTSVTGTAAQNGGTTSSASAA